MRLALLALVFFIYALAPLSAQTYTVICYHTFDGNGNPLDFSHAEVRAHIARLKRAGKVFITYRDVRAGRVTGENGVLVSIDDGHASVYDAYFEVFLPAGVAPLLAIYPAGVGEDEMLTWDELHTLTRAGCDIASHSLTHANLPRRASSNVIRELATSRAILSARLGVAVDAFVYPYGANASWMVPLVKDAGYAFAYTTRWGRVKGAGAYKEHAYLLRRYDLHRNDVDAGLHFLAR